MDLLRPDDSAFCGGLSAQPSLTTASRSGQSSSNTDAAGDESLSACHVGRAFDGNKVRPAELGSPTEAVRSLMPWHCTSPRPLSARMHQIDFSLL